MVRHESCSHWHARYSAFLLQNGFEYVAAHIFGVLEYMLECASTRPAWKHTQFIQCVGLALILTGQLLRSFAMIHASTNFSHALAHTKREDHTLVTTGVYALARHPSYAGFFWWALGTQIFLGNPVATVGFAVLLTRFFAHRIQSTWIHGPRRLVGHRWGVIACETRMALVSPEPNPKTALGPSPRYLLTL